MRQQWEGCRDISQKHSLLHWPLSTGLGGIAALPPLPRPMYPQGPLPVWTLRGARRCKRGVMLLLQELATSLWTTLHLRLGAHAALLSIQLSVSIHETFVGWMDRRMGGRMEATPSRLLHLHPPPLSGSHLRVFTCAQIPIPDECPTRSRKVCHYM